jgi:hypothetical protein
MNFIKVQTIYSEIWFYYKNLNYMYQTQLEIFDI